MISKTKLRHPTALMLSSVFSALNLSPRFHTIDEVAKALSAYYLGLSLRRVEALFHVPRNTVQYYWRKLANYSSPPPPPRVAVDETRIRVVNGLLYWLWVVRDLNTGKVVAVRLSETRSGLDVILLLEGGGIRVEEVREILHDGGPWYNILSTLGVNHEHETFGKRNLVEQVFRSLKLRLASMDKHFPHNASKVTILRWVKAFFTLYNLLQQGE
ncbi:IS6 family transposase [Saccharolobus islandicus]|uniref:IS6 family transposase n=1 Tax=Saccharolobus islandicus (strain REY15A) TaxID=930945 RepID=F0NCS0_SACI5|nr:IS6 family transposase [Sulfolobus islandicus]ADX86294.1 IS6 family transposase [Sulfolobus islandicus REY15A]